MTNRFAPRKMITLAQVRAIHVGLNKRGIDDAVYRQMLDTGWGVDTCKDLDRGQASELLRRIHGGRRGPDKPPTRRRIRQPAQPSSLPKSGVIRLASARQQRLINELVSEIRWESEDGYRRWLRRSLGIKQVRTAGEAFRVIEGLKGLKRHGHALEVE